MKLAKILLALLLSIPFVAQANSIQPPKGFAGDAYKATLLLRGHHGQRETDCTGVIYETIPGGYHVLSDGHCVEDGDGWTYTVADDVIGPESPVTVIKSEFDKQFDFAVFEFKTDKNYPVIPLGNTASVSMGDSVINPNFAAVAAKQLSFGTVSSGPMDKNWEPTPGGFLVQIFGAGGSSGSPIISASTHKIIGLVEVLYTDDETGAPLNIGMGVESIDNFSAFLKAPVIPRPSISDEEYMQKFGPQHTFMLTVHGPSPIFEFGGHKFQTQIMGLSLYDPYYYDVPVYIERDDVGGYRLMSTKSHFGVGVKLLS